MDKKQQLASLIEELNLPIPQDELNKNLENLSDEELDRLIESYSKVAGHEQDLDTTLKEIAPDDYDEVQAELRSETEEINKEYSANLEELQKISDDELDELEEKAMLDILETEESVEQDAQAAEEIKNEMVSALKPSEK